MKTYKENDAKVIDFAGTITFHKNDYAIQINDADENYETKIIIKDGVFIGVVKRGFISRIRTCIRLYKFMKA